MSSHRCAQSEVLSQYETSSGWLGKLCLPSPPITPLHFHPRPDVSKDRHGRNPITPHFPTGSRHQGIATERTGHCTALSALPISATIGGAGN